MSKLSSYVAIDIETTGLDLYRSEVIQLAAVLDNGNPGLLIEELPKFQVLINRSQFLYGEPYAFALNANLIKRSMTEGVSLKEAREQFVSFIRTHFPTGRITIAGKNVAGFDVPILKANGFDTNLFKHRVIDPGSMYLTDFGYVPTLDEINKLTGRDAVKHDALSDCYDVIAAIRHKVNK